MNDLDPTKVESLEDLAECLRQLHIRADKPAYRELEQQTIHANGLLPGTRLKRVRLGRTTLSDVLLGRKFPGKAFMLTLVEACGIDLEKDPRWEHAWNRLAERYLIQGMAAEVDQLRQQLAEARAQVEAAAAETERLRQLAGQKERYLIIQGTPPAPSAKQFFDEFDPTLYGMPEGQPVEGNEGGSEKREEQLSAALTRFNAHRRLFEVSGYDLTMTVPLTFPELVLGAEIRVRPLRHREPITIRVPPGTPTGRTFLIRGKGAPQPDGTHGNLRITVRADIPDHGRLDSYRLELVEQLRGHFNGDDLRADYLASPL